MKTKKVLVAMSGGVDSSVAAYLLKEQGYEVAGALMKTFAEPVKTCHTDTRANACCGTDAILDARRVAQNLDIPFYVLEYEESFHKLVIDEFIEEYKRGRTPNPCVTCNNKVKFLQFFRYALSLGMDFIATGHYAILQKDLETERHYLIRGEDQKKDQSYVLYGLKQDVLSKLLLPLADLKKEKVREIAGQIGLDVASKPDSQEICFVTSGDYREFLRENGVDAKPGSFVLKSGKILGTHRGLPFYTLGQRKGLGISHPEPLYVIGFNRNENQVILGTRSETRESHFLVKNPNFMKLNRERLLEWGEVTGQVQIRAHHPGAPAKAWFSPEGDLNIESFEPLEAITPGQSAVFYDGNQGILFGGVIEKIFPKPRENFHPLKGEKILISGENGVKECS